MRMAWVACALCACGTGFVSPATGSAEDGLQGPVRRALASVAAHPAETSSGAGDDFAPSDVVTEADGREHVRLERRWRGLRVLGGDLVVHGRSDGSFEDASLALPAPVGELGTPVLTPYDAVQTALDGMDAAAKSSPSAELVVSASESGAALAWEVVADTERGDGTPSEWHALVDAKTGVLLDAWDGVQTAAATGRGYYDGAVPLTVRRSSGRYALLDATRGSLATRDLGGATSGAGALFSRGDPSFGAAARERPAVDAQFGAAVTWDLFRTLGRLGPAGNGAAPPNRVHFGSGYDNAFWSDACGCMSYGDGDGVEFGPFTALDVVGHELTHGVTSHTAKLRYSREPGGLNEATSDIFGTLVEFRAADAASPANYTIGERIHRGAPLRDMAWPEKDGRSAGCWSSSVARLDPHYSSGVANHFFYLLAEGTTAKTHTCRTGARFAGIGREEAGRIWYRALTLYFTSTTTYRRARAATERSARDLYGAGSKQLAAVKAAWNAVLVP